MLTSGLLALLARPGLPQLPFLPYGPLGSDPNVLWDSLQPQRPGGQAPSITRSLSYKCLLSSPVFSHMAAKLETVSWSCARLPRPTPDQELQKNAHSLAVFVSLVPAFLELVVYWIGHCRDAV